MDDSKKSSGCGEGALRLGLVGEGGQLQQPKTLKLFADAILLVIRQSALATQPMFASCMPFVPVCVQDFNNNTNPLALAVEFAHTMHQHTHAPHRPRPAGPTALGSGGGGVWGVMGDCMSGWEEKKQNEIQSIIQFDCYIKRY